MYSSFWGLAESRRNQKIHFKIFQLIFKKFWSGNSLDKLEKVLLSNIYTLLLGNPYKNFTLVVLAELPSIFMYLKLPHWFGRKNILISSQIITGICCIIGGLLTQVKSLKKGAVHHKFHEFPIPNSNFQKKKIHWL